MPQKHKWDFDTDHGTLDVEKRESFNFFNWNAVSLVYRKKHEELIRWYLQISPDWEKYILIDLFKSSGRLYYCKVFKPYNMSIYVEKLEGYIDPIWVIGAEKKQWKKIPNEKNIEGFL